MCVLLCKNIFWDKCWIFVVFDLFVFFMFFWECVLKYIYLLLYIYVVNVFEILDWDLKDFFNED